jgi:hypothetical protein
MARPDSKDLRDPVVGSVAGGRSLPRDGCAVGGQCGKRREVVTAVSGDRECGGETDGGRRQLALAQERDWLLARLATEPDLTLRALLGELIDRKVVVSYGAVWNFFASEGITFKKSLHAAEQDRPDVARRRARWRQYQGRLDPARMVFIDGTWAKTNMTRIHGRSARCMRLVDKVPHGRWRTLTFLAALRHNRIDAPCALDGPINGPSFLAYVEQIDAKLDPRDRAVL